MQSCVFLCITEALITVIIITIAIQLVVYNAVISVKKIMFNLIRSLFNPLKSKQLKGVNTVNTNSHVQ